jgi:hypothetical protein
MDLIVNGVCVCKCEYCVKVSIFMFIFVKKNEQKYLVSVGQTQQDIF